MEKYNCAQVATCLHFRLQQVVVLSEIWFSIVPHYNVVTAMDSPII